MLTIRSVVPVKGIRGQEVIEFMLNCTDEDYQKWWPGTHLTFHTLKRYPNNLGNLVYFDEYIGRYRLQFKGVVTEIIPNRKIVWQMLKGIRLPAWLILEFKEQHDGVVITHTVKAGFEGGGKILDPLLRLYFTAAFITALNQHAQIEFPKLAESLSLDLFSDPR